MTDEQPKAIDPGPLSRHVPWLDASQYQDYRTTERGYRRLIGTALVGLTILFFLGLGLLIAILTMPTTGTTRIPWIASLRFGAGLATLFLLLSGVLVVGTRQFSSESSTFPRLLRWVFWRAESKLDLDEAPAQLARQRGDWARALSLYNGWRRAHPDRLDLIFRLAEIHHLDTKNLEGALHLYRTFVHRVEERGDKAHADLWGLSELARAHIADLEVQARLAIQSEGTPPEGAD